MNSLVVGGVVVVMIALRFLKPNPLGWIAAWWFACWIAFKFGIQPPLPSSIVVMFMGIVSFALLVYVAADSDRLKGFTGPVVTFIVDRRFGVSLVIVALLVPALVSFRTYLDSKATIQPPTFGRTIHPAPPDMITFKGKQMDLINDENPYRELEDQDPDAWQAHVQNGRRIYYQNCVFCHGDDMDGDGVFAHGLNPIPASFADATTIAMLQETYLFWRIAKGAPGLPDEAGPWSSAMPAWEQFLSEEEIWDVIIYLYEHTGQKPRAREFHNE